MGEHRFRRWLAVSLVLAGSGTAQQVQTDHAAFLHTGDVVLFAGDSITDGGRQREGSDYNHIMGQDYAYLLAAELGYRYPDRGAVFLNRGISGDRVKDLERRWQADVIDQRPELLSVLVGINDTLADGERAETVAEFEATYDRLLARTLQELPRTRIVLGEPFLLPVGKYAAGYTGWRARTAERQAVVAKLAAKYRLPLIRYQAAFDEAAKSVPADHWSWDGVHPTYAGHALMAAEWLKTVGAAWPR